VDLQYAHDVIAAGVLAAAKMAHDESRRSTVSQAAEVAGLIGFPYSVGRMTAVLRALCREK
jgi:hypothetical protein